MLELPRCELLAELEEAALDDLPSRLDRNAQEIEGVEISITNVELHDLVSKQSHDD